MIEQEDYLQSELDGQQAEQAEAASSAGEERGGDPSQYGSELFEQEKMLSVDSTLLELLREVRHALHKIDAGTYGVCDNCGLEIPAERLLAYPQASTCLECKNHEEHAHHGQRAFIPR